MFTSQESSSNLEEKTKPCPAAEEENFVEVKSGTLELEEVHIKLQPSPEPEEESVESENDGSNFQYPSETTNDAPSETVNGASSTTINHTNRKRYHPYDRVVSELLNVEKEKLKLCHERLSLDKTDEDVSFFYSLLPHVKKLPPNEKLMFRIKVQQLLLDSLR